MGTRYTLPRWEKGTDTRKEAADGAWRLAELSGYFWPKLLVKMGLYRSYEMANKAIRRAHRNGLIRPVENKGRPDKKPLWELRPGDRPTTLFTASELDVPWRMIVSHEVPASEISALYYPHMDEIRGPYGVSYQTLPDREWVRGLMMWSFEWYVGKQTEKQLVARLKKYKGTGKTILAAARKHKYLTKVWEAAVKAEVSEQIGLATYDDIMKDPLGKIWWVHGGKQVAINLDPKTDTIPDAEPGMAPAEVD